MGAPVSVDTLAARAAARIEADIVSGALAPDSRLGITETAERYGVGATPLREALSWLAARGLVNAIGQRGFRVRALSREDLADIVCIRSVIEREALRLSMERGGAEWEGEIVGALHRLKRYLAARPQAFQEGDAEFDVAHKRFHTSLLSACGSPRLLATHADLYDQAYRYRRLMMAGFYDSSEFLANHERLAELAIDRVGAKALDALGAHIAYTIAHVYPAAKEATS
jgi:DNA-binding GntR family transcriptional regulator